ncbi:MAG: biopolymer transporter ExbD [Bacteroidales bacterium]|nr:biopolymer transporter ExbD [Bacteroidales bacterium]
MAKFSRKDKNAMPAISTASLPDIVFMLLFFFMVSTSMRDTTMMVSTKLPEASEVAKLKKKSLVSYIYVGPPTREHQRLFGTEPRIQLNDSFKTLVDIRDFISSERDAMNESDRPLLTTSLKIDEETRMRIVTDIKQELRKASALKISYAARQVDRH